MKWDGVRVIVRRPWKNKNGKRLGFVKYPSVIIAAGQPIPWKFRTLSSENQRFLFCEKVHLSVTKKFRCRFVKSTWRSKIIFETEKVRRQIFWSALSLLSRYKSFRHWSLNLIEVWIVNLIEVTHWVAREFYLHAENILILAVTFMFLEQFRQTKFLRIHKSMVFFWWYAAFAEDWGQVGAVTCKYDATCKKGYHRQKKPTLQNVFSFYSRNLKSPSTPHVAQNDYILSKKLQRLTADTILGLKAKSQIFIWSSIQLKVWN